jgi:hypothetical protein
MRAAKHSSPGQRPGMTLEGSPTRPDDLRVNWPMLFWMTVPALMAGWAYWTYGGTADVIGAAAVGVILMGVSAALALILKLRRR